MTGATEASTIAVGPVGGPETMLRMNHEEILALHAAVIAARLVESRAALLVGIDPRFVAALPRAANPSAQILLDLESLNAVGSLLDGSVPLSIWLATALALAEGRTEAAIFREALDRHRDPRGRSVTPEHGDEPRAGEVRLFNLSAAQQWTIPVTPNTAVHEIIGKLQSIIGTQPWTAKGTRKPGSTHKYRLYASETEVEPLPMKTTVAELSPQRRGAPLSLNVEWYTVVRGSPVAGPR